ncbi:aminotransferase class V-fold PLP-dependent enzyme [bacterium]|nr:aminotransferase class V-fold PLP-dependent enzyme [bacterium]
MQETLDPENWEQFSQLAQQMLSDMLTHLRTLPEQPAWREMPPGVRQGLQEDPLPWKGHSEAEVYQQFFQQVLPYPNGNLHPRFYGWVQGNGTPLAMMADMLAAGLNPHMAGFNQAPALVEKRVLDWLRQLMGFPPESGALLVGGGSMANLIGLTVARDRWLKGEALLGNSRRPVVYGSTQTHAWVTKALRLLGLGADTFRALACDDQYRLDLSDLRQRLKRDRAAGMEPLAIVATVGTVNTGAIDRLDELADLCALEKIWLHLDGAFGALARLAPALAIQVKGLERADSLAFDLHKWMYLPFECACALVRDGNAQRRSFELEGSYIEPETRGVIAGGLPFAQLGLELTRNFKALKVWMCMKSYGVEKIGRIIQQNVDQAAYLVEQIKSRPELELAAPAPLNVVCFSYRGVNNRELLTRLHESGRAVPSGTTLGGQFVLRVCLVNHRTRQSDLDLLLDSVLEIGGWMKASASQQ